jgi:threonylcarbamoyladenosine tRNA methylthiotransferase MtaB
MTGAIPTFAIQTLGCKLNQLESEAIAEAFKKAGFVIAPWEKGADIMALNTCTVTSKAEQKARRIIRAAMRQCPGARFIVTGCYARLDGAIVPGVEVMSKTALLALPEKLTRDNAGWSGQCEAPGTADSFSFNAQNFSFHSRAFLKIQDGCDNRCAYCRVCLARGPSRSLDPGLALERLQALEAGGYNEAVLTGVNLNQYQAAGKGLAGLLETLLAGTGRIALRLSSLEPDEITEELITVLADKRIRPHFHLSFQSASPAVLARMRRSPDAAALGRIIRAFRQVKDDPFLACDVISGFPGESEADFQMTLDFCREAGFAWIHAFPYSPRPGTEAYGFHDHVPEREAVKRVGLLSELAREGRAAYIRRWEGRLVDAVVEEDGAGLFGLSENYLRLCFTPMEGAAAEPRLKPGSLTRCRIGKALFPEDPHHDAESKIIPGP